MQHLVSSTSTIPNPPKKLASAEADAELISLKRFHGKKIPVFKAGPRSIEWVLLEDVQKTYYSRMTAESFFSLLSSTLPGIAVPISGDASKAFKSHYDMEESELFEEDIMLTFYSLSTIVDKLPPATTNMKSQSNIP